MDFLSILLLHICMASMGFTIITMASTDSLWSISGTLNGMDHYSSCGLFSCRSIDKLSMSDIHSGCSEGKAISVTMEIFSVLTVLVVFVPYCIHIMQAMSRGSMISYTLAKICRRLHLLSMLTSLFVWILMVVYYTTSFCSDLFTPTSKNCSVLFLCRPDKAIKDQFGNVKAGYGIYLMVAVSVIEFLAFMICMAQKDTWSSVLVKPRPDNDIQQSLINTPVIVNMNKMEGKELDDFQDEPVPVPPMAE
eukprot:TRINITY_DN9088_c0_g1_i1.p1 TRINITY_DN9088_c0_g1~~TRINITY_DN9088_c0_g1_i1.p1  ORF type:complete len:249 (+),score=22.96 TRINITY_DN9088_c0_g1_i1:67-813(+)